MAPNKNEAASFQISKEDINLHEKNAKCNYKSILSEENDNVAFQYDDTYSCSGSSRGETFVNPLKISHKN